MAKNHRGSTPSIRVAFNNAKIVQGERDSNQIVIEFTGVQQVMLDGMQDVKMVDPDTMAKRKLTDEEVRDFEDAIQAFVDTRVARQLKKFIAYTEPGQNRDDYGNPDIYPAEETIR